MSYLPVDPEPGYLPPAEDAGWFGSSIQPWRWDEASGTNKMPIRVLLGWQNSADFDQQVSAAMMRTGNIPTSSSDAVMDAVRKMTDWRKLQWLSNHGENKLAESYYDRLDATARTSVQDWRHVNSALDAYMIRKYGEDYHNPWERAKREGRSYKGVEQIAKETEAARSLKPDDFDRMAAEDKRAEDEYRYSHRAPSVTIGVNKPGKVDPDELRDSLRPGPRRPELDPTGGRSPDPWHGPWPGDGEVDDVIPGFSDITDPNYTPPADSAGDGMSGRAAPDDMRGSLEDMPGYRSGVGPGSSVPINPGQPLPTPPAVPEPVFHEPGWNPPWFEPPSGDEEMPPRSSFPPPRSPAPRDPVVIPPNDSVPLNPDADDWNLPAPRHGRDVEPLPPAVPVLPPSIPEDDYEPEPSLPSMDPVPPPPADSYDPYPGPGLPIGPPRGPDPGPGLPIGPPRGPDPEPGLPIGPPRGPYLDDWNGPGPLRGRAVAPLPPSNAPDPLEEVSWHYPVLQPMDPSVDAGFGHMEHEVPWSPHMEAPSYGGVGAGGNVPIGGMQRENVHSSFMLRHHSHAFHFTAV